MTAAELNDKTILVTNGATLTCKGDISWLVEAGGVTGEGMLDHYDVIIDNDVTIEDSIVCKILHVLGNAQAVAYGCSH